jgi:N-acetylmuramoyl-L-alanine amidase
MASAANEAQGAPRFRISAGNLCGFTKSAAPFSSMLRPGFFFSTLWLWCLTSVLALARPTVIIDPGHGGHDRGGVPGVRYAEKIYALDVAKRVSARLRSAGYRTVMTRSGDYFVSLSGRCAVANRYSNAIFVSVHFNAAPRRSADGIETYYYGRSSSGLASSVHRRVVAAAGTEDRGVRRRSFYVLRHTRCPAILVEGGFLSNPSEGARIARSSSHRQRLADAIASGIIARYR